MGDKTVLRIGAWAAIVGGIIAILVNVFAARPSSGELGDPLASVNLAMTTKGWELTEIGVAVALLILLAAFYAITKSIVTAPAKGWARLGLGAILMATTIGVTGFVINAGMPDGAGFLGAEGMAGAAFVAGAILKSWTLTYFGLGAFLFGIALTLSDGYPTWLGGATLLAGLVGLVDGFMEIVSGASKTTTYFLFPIASGLLTLIILYVGVLLFRKAASAD